jgi:hypothetical protein
MDIQNITLPDPAAACCNRSVERRRRSSKPETGLSTQRPATSLHCQDNGKSHLANGQAKLLRRNIREDANEAVIAAMP